MRCKVKRMLVASLALALSAVVLSAMPLSAHAASTHDMHRLYNPNSGEHFYTGSTSERDGLVKLGWRYEGVGWTAPASSGTPVHRLYNPNAGDHHYTMSASERDILLGVGWTYEGIGWYSDDARAVPLYRQYNPNARAGAHNYTTSRSENDNLVRLGWKGEGIGWYGASSDAALQTVTFDSMGGSAVASQKVEQGGTATEPTTPTRDGYRFSGWCVDQNGSYPYFFSNAVWGDITIYASWSKIQPLAFTGDLSDTCSYAGTISLYTNNPIASIDVSDDKVLTISGDPPSSDTMREVIGTELGESIITLTDVYGQTLSKTIAVTESMSDRDRTGTIYSMSHYDATMMVPAIESVAYGRGSGGQSYVDVGCPGTFDTTNPYGYEGLICANKEFNSALETYYADSEWNGLGYTCISLSTTVGLGRTYYVKVRSYRFEGTTKVYGPWSAVRELDIPNYSKDRSTPAHYSYQMYLLGNTGSDIYSNLDRAVYIKTDNPDPNSISLSADGKDALASISVMGGRRLYDDVNYLWKSDEQQTLQKVDGGYLGTLELESAGSTKIVVTEYDEDGGAVAATYQWDVLDYNAELAKWEQKVIEDCTTPSMSPTEKMAAVSSYFLSSEGLNFRYVTVHGETRLHLAMIPTSPVFLTHRWDSYISPAMLCEFATAIGGFSDVHDCYGDYASGTPGWISTHFLCRATYQGADYYYQACPATPTGEVGEPAMIDFSNTSQFIEAPGRQ